MLLYTNYIVFKALYSICCGLNIRMAILALYKAMCILLRISIFAVSSFDKLFLIYQSSDQQILNLHNYFLN